VRKFLHDHVDPGVFAPDAVRTLIAAIDANFLGYPASMDREMLKRHLAEAEEHIATGDKNIARQREVIAQLERDGRDTASARTFLHEFEQLQARHIAERERLLRELSEL
jgi:hypothetical protein